MILFKQRDYLMGSGQALLEMSSGNIFVYFVYSDAYRLKLNDESTSRPLNGWFEIPVCTLLSSDKILITVGRGYIHCLQHGGTLHKDKKKVFYP